MWPYFFLWFGGIRVDGVTLPGLVSNLGGLGTPIDLFEDQLLTRVILAQCPTDEAAVKAAKALEKLLGLQLVVMTKDDSVAVTYYKETMMYFHQGIHLIL